MIRIEFYKYKGNYFGFRETGHAEFEEEGKDIICSAVSAMTMLIINTLEECFDSTVLYELEKDTADIIVMDKDALEKYCDDEKKQYAVSNIFKGYYIQLKDMADEYSDYISVTEIEKYL